MSLIGKFYLWDTGDGFSTGEVYAQLTAEFYLLKSDAMNDTPDFNAYRIACLPVVWSELTLFNSRDELDGYLEWLDTPSEGSKPKIVAINNGKKPE